MGSEGRKKRDSSSTNRSMGRSTSTPQADAIARYGAGRRANAEEKVVLLRSE